MLVVGLPWWLSAVETGLTVQETQVLSFGSGRSPGEVKMGTPLHY